MDQFIFGLTESGYKKELTTEFYFQIHKILYNVDYFKTKKVWNHLSFTPFIIDFYCYLLDFLKINSISV